MKNGKGRTYAYLFIGISFIMTVCTLAPGLSDRTWAQEKGTFLADRHQAKGMDCATCHKESPPKAAVPSAVCLQCHGDAEKLAMKTSGLKPNPHDSHLGDVACEQCHHGHKASEDMCAKCHNFGFKVR